MSIRSTADALALLGLGRPKLSGKTQADVDAKLQEWKDSALKQAYKARLHDTHPDKNDAPDAAAKFNEVREAYAQLLDLRVTLKVPRTECPLGHTRIPAEAKFCHECGHSYEEEPIVSRLKARGILPHTIAELRSSGELDEFRSLDPLSPLLAQKIEILFHRQRLGMIGPYSGWPREG